MTVQYGFFFDQGRCTDCRACVLACREWHDIPAGPVKWCRMFQWEKVYTPTYASTSYTLPVITARIQSVFVPVGITPFIRRRSTGQSLSTQRSAKAIGDAGRHVPMVRPSSRVMSQEPKCQSAQCA